MVLKAAGVGIYVPYSLNHKVSGVSIFDEDDNGELYYDYRLKSTAGIGLAFSTNLGKNSVFGYKIAFEMTQQKAKDTTFKLNKKDIINSFEFALLNRKYIKLWLGPRVNIGLSSHKSDSLNQAGFEVGIAPAAGINIMVGKHIALTADIDYKYAFQFGAKEYTDAINRTYFDRIKGPTIRFGIFFKFAELYK